MTTPNEGENMDTLVVKKGNKGDPLSFSITNDDGTVKDLTGLTATFKVWSPGDPETLIVTSACTTGANPALGICTYTPGATDFTVNNIRYEAEIELTETGVIINTISYRIVVQESA
jgi:hypothetical protein